MVENFEEGKEIIFRNRIISMIVTDSETRGEEGTLLVSRTDVTIFSLLASSMSGLTEVHKA